MIAILLFLTLCLSPAASASQAAPKPYDIVVLVMARGDDPPSVTVTYPRIVDHAALRAGIDELGRRANFTPSRVAVRDAPLSLELDDRGTDATFLAPGVVRDNDPLPVGQIVDSLPYWEHMRLVFLLPDEYSFSGPADAVAGEVVVRLVNTVTAYEYDVERMSGRGVPAEQSAGASPTAAQDESGPSAAAAAAAAGTARAADGRGLLLAILIGMPSGLLVGWLLYGSWERIAGSRRARRRPQESAAPASQPGDKPEAR